MKRFFVIMMVSALASCAWMKPRKTSGNGPHPVPPCGGLELPAPEIPYAQAVPGREGFVISPYHNKVVDCQGLKRDTLVFDPYDTAEPRRKFRVP